MSRRVVLTKRQRDAIFALPADEPSLMRHCIMSEDDLAHVRRRRRVHNRLGFALQLCAFRYPGRLLQPGEMIPESMLSFVGGQIGASAQDLLDYGVRAQTRYEHSAALQQTFGYRAFEGLARQEVTDWLVSAAETARTSEALAGAMVEELRRRRIIVPAATTVERTCADALVLAERRITAMIADRLEPTVRQRLTHMLHEGMDGDITRFVWLRRHEAGHNSAGANRLLDRLEWIEGLNVPASCLVSITPHRIARLRRQGERYFADGLRKIPETRRLAILAVCAIEWRAAVTDALVETHDRIVGKLYRAAERIRDARIAEQKSDVAQTLRAFAQLGTAVTEARTADGDVEAAIGRSVGWFELERLTAAAMALTRTISADPLDHVGMGHARFRRYVPRMLDMLDLRGGNVAVPLLDAIASLRDANRRGIVQLPYQAPVAFARPKWRKRFRSMDELDRRTWETAVVFSLREALRSGDVWLPHSRRHREIGADLVPIATVGRATRLAVPLNAAAWIEDRHGRLDAAMDRAGEAVHRGMLPTGAIENGELRVERLDRADVPGADELVLQLYRNMPETRITDLLPEVDQATGFTDAFTDLRTGSPCRDRIGLLNVILADGVNLGLKKMAASIDTHTHWQLLRVARWHVEHDAYERALAIIVEAQAGLPMACVWGEGLTSSSDGQFFPAGGAGEAMNLVNAKYDNDPGLKAYTHVSDQFALFALKTIPATAHESPFILDGLVGNEIGRQIREHYADTGGFTDHVFAVCSILGYVFAPRIRDLPHKRLYAFDPNSAHPTIRPLVAGRIRTDLIERNWPDILRLAASIALGTVVPSTILRKLASYPRQNDLAQALREVGRVERSLFMLGWITDAGQQQRAQLGLNKGEAHHALKRAIAFNRRGEIRDRSAEGQHHRMAALNLLAAVIIHWNTRQLGNTVAGLAASSEVPDPALLRHVSPLGWEHINLSGEYRWPA